jgi:hypothetical protein
MDGDMTATEIKEYCKAKKNSIILPLLAIP